MQIAESETTHQVSLFGVLSAYLVFVPVEVSGQLQKRQGRVSGDHPT